MLNISNNDGLTPESKVMRDLYAFSDDRMAPPTVDQFTLSNLHFDEDNVFCARAHLITTQIVDANNPYGIATLDCSFDVNITFDDGNIDIKADKLPQFAFTSPEYMASADTDWQEQLERLYPWDMALRIMSESDVDSLYVFARDHGGLRTLNEWGATGIRQIGVVDVGERNNNLWGRLRVELFSLATLKPLEMEFNFLFVLTDDSMNVRLRIDCPTGLAFVGKSQGLWPNPLTQWVVELKKQFPAGNIAQYLTPNDIKRLRTVAEACLKDAEYLDY